MPCNIFIRNFSAQFSALALLLFTFLLQAEEIRFTTMHSTIYAIDISANGSTVVLGDGNIIRVFETWSQTQLNEFSDPAIDEIISIRLSPDSTLLAAGGRNGNISVFDFIKGKLLTSFMREGEIINSLDISPDSRFLVAGTSGKVVAIYDLMSKELKAEWLRENDVMVTRFSPTGNILAAAGGDGYIGIYDTETFTLIDSLDKHNSWVRTLDFNHDGTRMVSGDDRGRIFTWTVNVSNIVFRERESFSKGWITSIDFFDNENNYMFSTIKGRLCIILRFAQLKGKKKGLVHHAKAFLNDQKRIHLIVSTLGEGVSLLQTNDFKSK